MSRLDKLTQMLKMDPSDPFVLYGIAQEHARIGTPEHLREAVRFFDMCIAADPAHGYAFYHKGATLLRMGEPEQARVVILAGIESAKRSGDGKALGELQTLLEQCDL
ncbi:MAG: hypothetical protein KF768_06360 [Phycisphaeraceae bacterium]|nr:hypothetical protein [Phycisphaeraceae bacterium]